MFAPEPAEKSQQSMANNTAGSFSIDRPSHPRVGGSAQVGRCKEAGAGLVFSSVQELSFREVWAFPLVGWASVRLRGQDGAAKDAKTGMIGSFIHQGPRRVRE